MTCVTKSSFKFSHNLFETPYEKRKRMHRFEACTYTQKTSTHDSLPSTYTRTAKEVFLSLSPFLWPLYNKIIKFSWGHHSFTEFPVPTIETCVWYMVHRKILNLVSTNHYCYKTPLICVGCSFFLTFGGCNTVPCKLEFWDSQASRCMLLYSSNKLGSIIKCKISSKHTSCTLSLNYIFPDITLLSSTTIKDSLKLWTIWSCRAREIEKEG